MADSFGHSDHPGPSPYEASPYQAQPHEHGPGVYGPGSYSQQRSAPQRTVAGTPTCGVGAMVGAILDRQALQKIRTDPTLTGAGMAKAGIIIGCSIVGLVIAYLMFGLAMLTLSSIRVIQ